jgi:hypothetical protein
VSGEKSQASAKLVYARHGQSAEVTTKRSGPKPEARSPKPEARSPLWLVVVTEAIGNSALPAAVESGSANESASIPARSLVVPSVAEYVAQPQRARSNGSRATLRRTTMHAHRSSCDARRTIWPPPIFQYQKGREARPAPRTLGQNFVCSDIREREKSLSSNGPRVRRVG